MEMSPSGPFQDEHEEFDMLPGSFACSSLFLSSSAEKIMTSGIGLLLGKGVS